jgi:sodium/hydrogen antiporter
VFPAVSPGFGPGDVFALGLLFAGLAIFAAIGALSHQRDRAFSASLIYLGLGLIGAAAIEVLGVGWLSPLEDAALFERLTEFAVIVALFATGLKLDRALRWSAWRSVVRLLVVAMPLTIGALVLWGTAVMGLSLAAAIALGAVLAPTDPVLAGDVGVGPPGDEDEREPNFSITGEAGFNDGLAYPFVFLAYFVATEDGTGWLAGWALGDGLYAITVGIGLGALLGYLLAAAVVRLRDRELLAHEFDGWVAIGAVLLIYGFVEELDAYGFLAAFAGGVAFRRYEHTHEYNHRVHAGAEMVEKFAELAVVLLVASTVTLTGLGHPGLGGWLLVPVALLFIRPAAVLIALAGRRMPLGDRAFVAWFGVRGIGSIYYVSVMIGLGVLPDGEMATVYWTVAATVLVSIVVHGVSSAPLSRRWLPATGAAPPDGPSPAARRDRRG